MKKVLLCLMTITIISCDIKEEIISQLGDGKVKATINGQTKTWNFGPNSVGATISSADSGIGFDYAFGLGASTDGVSDNSETTAIGVVLFMDSPDLIVAGATFTYPNDLIGGTYTYENSDGSTTIDADNEVSATMTINSVDQTNERISGTFSYVTVDEDTNITYTVSNGSFINIPFYNE